MLFNITNKMSSRGFYMVLSPFNKKYTTFGRIFLKTDHVSQLMLGKDMPRQQEGALAKGQVGLWQPLGRELKPILRVCLGIKVGLLESSMPRTQFAAQISTYLLGKEVDLNSSLVSYSSCCRAHFDIMILSSFMSPHNSLSPNPVVKHATHEPLQH